jgi:putative transposase
MQRKFIFSIGEYYHIFNRGVDKRIIFLDKRDYDRFIKLLYIANSANSYEISALDHTDFFKLERGSTIVDICAYSLMPNHFHLVLKEVREGGISQFMKKLLTGYSMYFNARHERSGALFQGRFQGRHLNTDEYLKHAPLYVHMNTLDLIESGWKDTGIKHMKKAEEFTRNYQYSSFWDYCDKIRAESTILNKNSLPQYYEDTNELLEDLRDWMLITPHLL